MDYDVAIIGAGAVGLAVARALSGGGLRAVVFERHASFGWETSSRNSEVVHAGIYYKPGSLKAKLCVEGNAKLYEWCESRRVPSRKIGKYLIAIKENEVETLEGVCRNAQENGARGVEMVSNDRLRREEPYVKAAAGAFSPSTGIIDSHKYMESLVEAAKDAGCDFAFAHEVVAIGKISGGYRLLARHESGEEFGVDATRIVNSAGLDSDRVAAMAGLDARETGYELAYCQGRYFRLSPGKNYLARHLIYPVPQKNYAGLGVHVTLDLAGGVKFGPDAEYIPRELRYAVDEKLRDKFYEAASSYLIGLERGDLSPDQAGIRPKLQRAGEPERDFVIAEESSRGLPGFINLIGIESPGLTSSLAIGDLAMKFI